MKKVISLLLCCLMVASLCIPAFAMGADDTISPYYLGTQTTHNYSYTYGTPTSMTKGNWTCIYTGEPAARDGEYDTVSHSVSYGATFSGSFMGNIKDKIQVEFGISFSKSTEFGISKNSAPLKKGEYIKAYWIKSYDSYDVTQKDLKHIYGWELQGSGGTYVPVDRYETETSHVTVNKPLQPKLKIEYWKDGKMERSADAGDTLERIEYYELIGGVYQMVYGEG